MVETGILNALLQGVVTGGIIAAGALGLSLVYSIAEVPNFAHGDMLTVGAYLALALNSPSDLVLVPDVVALPFAVAAVGAVALAGALGAVYEKAVFKQFRGNDADLITMVIVSLGLALVLRNLVLFLVGTQNVTYDTVRRVNVNVDLYVTGSGVAVELNQRAGGALQPLDAWGYSWPVVAVGLLVAAAVGVAVYRWRTGDQSFEQVHFVSPWIWGVSAGSVALAAIAAVARGPPLSVADAAYGTRVGVSQKFAVIVAVMVATML
ncbi:MAG: branched-chain amino acid ABC transporter permease, partial [Halobacterium sp.]